jgi:glycosyltransferase involved in cell wall biosynthesis
MRIAIFTNNYLPNPYGVTQSIESFRRQLEKQGHAVFIFAPYYKNYPDKNPNVFRYPALDINYKIKFPLAIPYSRKIDKILENLKIDIIHSQHPNLLGSAAMKWAQRKNIPLVFTWHTLYDQYAHFVPLIPPKWTAKYIIRKAAAYANKCDFVITPTESVKKIIQDWRVKNKNIGTVSSGVDEDNFLNPDREGIRKKYDIRDDEALLFSVCRLTKEKNIEFLFESVIKVLKDNSKTKFLIVSEGDLRDYLNSLVKKENLSERVIFTGVIAREEIKNYFAAGDIFVYASKSETQGMIITEAMYAGLPVVAVDAPGVCDLVENNASGFLVPEDANKFSEAVKKLIADKNLREQLGRAGAQIAREKYTDEVCTRQMLEIYKSLIK